MMFPKASVGILATALVFLTPKIVAYDLPCYYLGYSCGYNLVSEWGYTTEELTAAVNRTGPIPPISDIQLLQVLYRCSDVNGTVTGNSFCMAGCISLGDATINDMCAM